MFNLYSEYVLKPQSIEDLVIGNRRKITSDSKNVRIRNKEIEVEICQKIIF